MYCISSFDHLRVHCVYANVEKEENEEEEEDSEEVERKLCVCVLLMRRGSVELEIISCACINGSENFLHTKCDMDLKYSVCVYRCVWNDDGD